MLSNNDAEADGRRVMRYRRLGMTGLDVSVIGLGTWQFGGEWGKQFSVDEVTALIGRAGELGINLIDTAECYGDHRAEELVGKATAADRGRWVVATKFGHRFHADRMGMDGWDPGSVRSDEWSPAAVVRQLEASLRALGTDYVDIYQSHGGSDEQFDTAGLWEALQEQVRLGKIRHLGISLDAHQSERARRAGDVGATVVQVPYSRLQQEADEGVLAVCAERDVGVLAREPLANGYLSGKYRPGTRIENRDDWRSSHDPREVDQKLRIVERLVATEVPAGTPLARWALAWCLRHPAVSAVIPGSKTIEQLEGNAAAAELLSDEHRPAAAPPT